MRAKIGTGARVTVGVEIRRQDAIATILGFVAEYLGKRSAIPAIEQGVRQNKWLTSLAFTCERDNKIYQRLQFKIDWERHDLRVAHGEGQIGLPSGSSVVTEISPSLIKILDQFDRYRRDHDMDVGCLFWHVETSNGKDVVEELGLTPTKSVNAGEEFRVPVPVRDDFDELTVRFSRYGTEPDKVGVSRLVKGEVTHVGDHYGFLRPNDNHHGRDYWFLLKSWKGKPCRTEAAAEFVANTDSKGRRVATDIRPL